MTRTIDWTYCSNQVIFKPFYPGASAPEFGLQQHSAFSPHWICELTLPAKELKEYREIEALLAETEGIGIVNAFDPRFPYPSKYKVGDAIPDIDVLAMSRANRTITVTGTPGDVIEKGDPIAFTHNGRRYYFKAMKRLLMTGGDLPLEVYLRPRETIASFRETIDRVRPAMRFSININDAYSESSQGLTVFKLIGREFWHKGP